MQTSVHNFPIHISLILERTKFIFWTNKSNDLNSNMIWVENSWYFLLMQLIRYEFTSQNTWVTDHTVVDNLFNQHLFEKSTRLTYYVNLQSYFLKYRWVILTSLTHNTISSVDRLFKNCNWLEREASEMYGVIFIGKMDSRKLLLDYSKIEHPMLKDFPSEGVKDVFYDILDNQIEYVTNETVEL